jgi:glycosyltransferase involved in cell wall biosynthesis
MNPFFSIIIPTHNRAHLISKALESVIAQSFINWELIIVDDGSTDNTKELIADYQGKDTRIRYIYQENAERSAARNTGLKNSNGKYICFLDSDDYFLPLRLSNLYDIINAEEFPKFYFTGKTLLDEDGNFEINDLLLTSQDIKIDLLFSLNIHSQQCCIHNDILKKYLYNTHFSIGEDLELWLRIFSEFTFIPLKENCSVIVVDHPERSVGIGKLESYQKQLNTLLHIKKLNHPISKKKLNSNIHGVLMSILRCHYYKREKWNFVQIFFLTLRYSTYESIKEKLFMLIKLI